MIFRCKLAVSATLLLLLSTSNAYSQNLGRYEPPRTLNGRPDLQGVWASAFITPIERPDGVTELIIPPERANGLIEKLSKLPVVIDPDVANYRTNKLAMVRGEYRSSLVVKPEDGRLPFSEKATEQLVQRDAKRPLDNPEDRYPIERCLSGSSQPPLRPSSVMLPSLIVQTPDAIVLSTEDVGGLRIVHMASSPPPDVLRTLEGWSAGGWEGDTLVIETTHMRGDPFRDQLGKRPIIVGEKSRVVERLTRVSDTELVVQFTVEDVDLYTAPWMGEYSLTRTDLPALEYGCHEANYGLANILLGARVADLRNQHAAPND